MLTRTEATLSTLLSLALALAPAAAQAAPPDDGEAEATDGDAEDAASEGEGAEGETEAAAPDAAEADDGADGSGEEAEPSDATDESPSEEGGAADGEEAEGEEPPAEEPPAEEAEADEDGDPDEAGMGEMDDMEAEGPERPPEPRYGDRPAKGTGMMIAGAVTLALGAAGLGTAFAITQCDYSSNLKCRYGSQRTLLVPIAATVTGLGAALLGVGVGKKVAYSKWESWTPEQDTAHAIIAPTMLRGGAGIGAVGRF
jgi:hypothetical protein